MITTNLPADPAADWAVATVFWLRRQAGLDLVMWAGAVKIRSNFTSVKWTRTDLKPNPPVKEFMEYLHLKMILLLCLHTATQ